MFLENNLTCLRERNPDLAERIAEKEDQNFEILPAKRQGNTLFQKNPMGSPLQLTSLYDPIQEAEQIVDAQWEDETTLAVAYGIMNFHYIDYIMSKLPHNGDLIIVEPEIGLLRMFFEKMDLTNYLTDNRFHIVSQMEARDAAYFVAVFMHLDPFRLPKMTFIEYPNYVKLNSGYFTSCTELIRDAYQLAFSNIATRLSFGNQWVKNALSNLNEVVEQHDLAELEGKLDGKPVILIAAGPSLNKNIELLRECKGKAFLLCVDTALRALVKVGIKPDAVVAVDGSEANARHFDGIEYSEVPLFASVCCHQEIVSRHKGIKYFFTSYDDILPWYSEILKDKLPKANLMGGGSVATIGFTIAMYLGASELIFVGQDLSYPGGKMYVTGAKHDKRTLQDVDSSRQRIQVTDIFGEPVFTTFDYFMYLKWFHAKLKLYSNDESKSFINATEGGALRENIKIMPLREVLETRLQRVYDYQELLERKWVSKSFEEYLPSLQNTVNEVQHILEIAIDCKEQLSMVQGLHKMDLLQFQQAVSNVTVAQEKILEFDITLKYLDAVSFREIFTDIYAELNNSKPDTSECATEYLHELNLSIQFFSRLEEISQQGLEILREKFDLPIEAIES